MRHPLVEVDERGTILRIDTCEAPDREPLTEFYAGILLPGLVNAHCHLELSCLQGQIPPGEGFSAFARAMGEVRHRFSESEYEQAMRRIDAQFREEGVVAVGDISNDARSFAVKGESPIHYKTFAEVYGLRTEDCSRQEPLLAYPHTSLTPHSIYSLQDRLFRTIAARGRELLSIHFMESEAESELYSCRGPLWEWYERVGFSCDFLHYGSPSQRLVESVPKERPVMLVHNCCVKKSDLDRILEHFTAPVHWCLCPASNRYISHLEPPVELLRQMGANICLGTDSGASNATLRMVDELRLLKGVPLEERLRWATQGGARALGLDHSLGTLEVGKCPGIVLLEGADLARMELTEGSTLRRLV